MSVPRYLEVSNREPSDTAEYPGEDLKRFRAADGTSQFSKKDGCPF